MPSVSDLDVFLELSVPDRRYSVLLSETLRRFSSRMRNDNEIQGCDVTNKRAKILIFLILPIDLI